MGARSKSGRLEGAGVAPGWPDGVRDVALEQLGRILSSPQFRATRRCSLLLQYVVEHASSNRFENLRERSLGVAVFERDPSYDSNEDPVVRIAAGEVRKRLAQYYQEPGHEGEPRITLPPGSYVPEFHLAPVKHEEAAASADVSEAPVSVPPGYVPHVAVSARWIWLAAGTVAAIAVALFLYLRPWAKTSLERFWEPVLAADGPVVVCLGQPKAYFFRSPVQAELDRWFEHRTDAGTRAPALQSIPIDDVVPAWDRLISVHDADAYARLSGLFAKMGRASSLRGGRLVSLSDLRGKPVVLIGAFSNDWTQHLAGQSRFYFEHDRQNSAMVVRDRSQPARDDWKVRNSWPLQKIPLDYAIVSRVHHPITERTVVLAAGITYHGTQAAGEFLTNESYFTGALRNAPADWARKNLQIVLSTQVVSGAAGPPKVLAIHVW